MIKITNDTSTLNGSLVEMKDQLIYELGEKGVTASYSSTTGLLGLIHKISEIPTETATITLATNKNILSYYNSETCTLTATHSQGAGKTVEVYNAVTGSKIGDMTDAGGGTYTYTYNSQRIGDISMTATSGNIESNSITIEDCYRYDPATTDNTSSYGTLIRYRGSSGTGAWNYNSTNGYYGTITDSTESMVTLPEITGQNDFTLEYDMLTTNTNGLEGLVAYEDNNNNSRLSAQKSSSTLRACVNGTATETSQNHTNSFNTNETVHFKFTVTNNQIVLDINKGTTVICSRTINYTPTQNTKYGFALVWNNYWTSETYIKNIKIKPITV